MEKRVFSGIKPSGDFHLGNYIGAAKRWVESQKSGLNIFCIVDMHAITVEQDPEDLKKRTLDLAALLISMGIDPRKSILFVQSHNSDHANLGWIMNCNASMGEMSRMTQYKEKSAKKDFVSVGLFDYPALMAADILLYDTTEVPVGEDQKQHVELTRDIAQRFNSRYGETFVLPKAIISKEGARIMSLADPSSKMSKSGDDPNGSIMLMDDAERIRKKIMSATTDSDNRIERGKDKPGINNLLEIYSVLSGESIDSLEKKYEGVGYGDFKSDLADIVVEKLSDIKRKFEEIRNSEELEKILHKGAEKAREISNKKLEDVFEKVGFIK